MKKKNIKNPQKNIYKIRGRDIQFIEEISESNKLRSEIEPWLTALFQSEHLSLFMGSGISLATYQLAGIVEKIDTLDFDMTFFKEQIEKFSKKSAKKSERGEVNFEDKIRVTNELIKGMKVYSVIQNDDSKKLKEKLKTLEKDLDNYLHNFSVNLLKNEKSIIDSEKSEMVAEYLMNFLVSFASRSSTRERLHIFTTNYDRIIEYGAELAGIRLVDRFVGTINPIFRSSRLDVDMHYNPPGIRGEPRYLEGVVQFTKLHGSLDWMMRDRVVRRIALPYGASPIKKFYQKDDTLMIYPNATKDRETSEYPYVDLFRDFAASICRPNSTVVIYGYSFGDEHINRVLKDMLTIPSTHLLIISFVDEGRRISKFYQKTKRPAQISLLIGNHFADLKTLVDKYLPKPAIDRTTVKMADLIRSRSIDSQQDDRKINKNYSNNKSPNS